MKQNHSGRVVGNSEVTLGRFLAESQIDVEKSSSHHLSQNDTQMPKSRVTTGLTTCLPSSLRCLRTKNRLMPRRLELGFLWGFHWEGVLTCTGLENYKFLMPKSRSWKVRVTDLFRLEICRGFLIGWFIPMPKRMTTSNGMQRQSSRRSSLQRLPWKTPQQLRTLG